MLRKLLMLWMIAVVGWVSAAAATRGNAPGNKPCGAWQENFNAGQLDLTRWTIASGPAPGYLPNQHVGYYDPANVSLDSGLLSLTLTQSAGVVDSNPDGIISYGSLIYTTAVCGYGTYEWTMKMSSTAICGACVGSAIPGSVSAGFLYVNNSQTEIDFEFSGQNPNTMWLVNWRNPDPRSDPPGSSETITALAPFDATSGFHTYKLIWSADRIRYYVDSVWIADHTTNVPSAPAHFMINHWGTDSSAWGGPASVGVARYFYVTRASYTPLR